MRKFSTINFQPLQLFGMILFERFNKFSIEHIDSCGSSNLEVKTDLTITEIDSLFWFKINNHPGYARTTIGIQLHHGCSFVGLDFMVALNDKEYLSIMSEDVDLMMLDNALFIKKLKRYLLKSFKLNINDEFDKAELETIFKKVHLWLEKNIPEIKIKDHFSTGRF